MSPSTSLAAISLAEIAELAHHGARASAPALLSVSDDEGGALVLGAWPGLGDAAHPGDPLVGFVAPESWYAIGLVASGQVRPLSGDQVSDAATGGRCCATTLVGRDGCWASIIADADADADSRRPTVLEGVPSGWVADSLARCLRHATPPPGSSPAAWLEAAWLDRVASGVLARPGGPWCWRYLAERHPSGGHGPLASPVELADRTRAFAASRSWEVLRLRHAADMVAHVGAERPPGPGSVLDAAQWFDDGSFSRWVVRNLAPAELLLVDLLAVLSPALGRRLVDALTTLGHPPPQRDP
ncbi:MAG: hypothetical protein ACR2LA_05470 [Acidimicrobiales bacterium]